MAENSTEQRKPRGRPFRKGQSGNPGGRPKSFASLVREQAQDGVDLVDIALRIARDDEHPKQLDAVKFLAAYGWGQPTQSVEHSGPAGEALSIIINTGAK